MSYQLSVLAHEKCATGSTVLQSAALTVILFWLLVLNGCGGLTTSSSTTNTSQNNSASALVISPTLPFATVGSMYDGTLEVSGGKAPYTFKLASGHLPAGVQLGAAAGTISGIPTASGSFTFAVSVSDSKGLSKQESLQVVVSASGNSTGQNQGHSFTNLQHGNGWSAYGQGPPTFVDCSPSPCDGITFSMNQGVSSPSMSGQATEYSLGGTAIYTDALFNNHLIGDLSSQGMPDSNHALVPTYHDFTYDVYFYGTNLELSQAVEFDINQFFDNLGFIWGHECRIAGGNEWDVWDNVNQHWVATGVACHPNNNAWNHLTIQVQRTSDNQLLYQSITLNGVTNTINKYYNPGSAPGWHGVTVNYQMDGNYQQSPYSVYLDNLTFTYE
jgi:Putative Ig domain